MSEDPSRKSPKLYCTNNPIRKSLHCDNKEIIFDEKVQIDSLETNLNREELTPREDLINNIKIFFKREIPNIHLTDFDLSRILYNNQKFIKDDFLHARKITGNSKPDLLVLLKIIYHVQNLTSDDKKLEKLGVNPHKLNKIKQYIRKTVIDFIFSNPYNIKYIKQDDRTKLQQETNYWRPEFELFIDLWYAASLNKGEPITIKTFQQTIGNPAFSTPTKIGKCNTKYFYKIFKNLSDLFPNISQEDHKHTHKNIRRYIKSRHLSEVYKDYSIYWEDEITKKAQIAILLLRDLGLDMITLEVIPSLSFNKNLDLHDPRKYQRHHIFINDKDKIDPNRLVLALLNSHPFLEGHADQIINLIRIRLAWKDECPKFYLKNHCNAQLLWTEFLKRRNDIIKKGIEYFFRNDYPDVVNRFYNDVPVGQLETAIKQTIQDWIQDGNPIPIIPKLLHNRFIC